MSDDILIKIRNLSFQYGSKVIFDNVNFDIHRGKVTAIMGPSGTGKTTLLKLIGGQLRPDKGTIELDGHNIHKLSRKKLYQLRKKIGVLFQSGALFTHLNTFENVAFPLREHTALPEEIIRDLVLMSLQMVGLRGASHLMPSELSGGMARRVAIARSLILNPHLVMYDEPFTGLDPIALAVISKLIRHLNDALHLTSIIVSHDVSETTAMADFIYIIAEGKVVGEGTPAQLLKDKSPHVLQFVHGLPDGAVPFHYPTPTKYDEDLLA